MVWYSRGKSLTAGSTTNAGGVSQLSNLTDQQSKFLETLYPSIKQSAKTHSLLPSVIAAQAILESGWGQSKLASPPYHNLFGVKAGSGWTGTSETFTTKEFVNGQYVETKATFRTYPSWSESIADHGKFFTSTAWRTQNYANYRAAKDYKTALAALQAAGYATDPNYASKLTAVIERFGLNRWDS